jgi:hypothetical protein
MCSRMRRCMRAYLRNKVVLCIIAGLVGYRFQKPNRQTTVQGKLIWFVSCKVSGSPQKCPPRAAPRQNGQRIAGCAEAYATAACGAQCGATCATGQFYQVAQHRGKHAPPHAPQHIRGNMWGSLQGNTHANARVFPYTQQVCRFMWQICEIPNGINNKRRKPWRNLLRLFYDYIRDQTPRRLWRRKMRRAQVAAAEFCFFWHNQSHGCSRMAECICWSGRQRQRQVSS